MAFAPVFGRVFPATFDRHAAAGNGLLNSLVAYWTLDETSGTRTDSVGSSHLTDYNTVGYAAGKIGNAGDFEATATEYLSVADNAALSMGDISFSIALWFYAESLPASAGTYAVLLSKRTDVGGVKLEYELTIDGGAPFVPQTIRFGCGNAPGLSGLTTVSHPTQLTTSTWYFVVCNYDADANLLGISVNASALTTASHSGGAFDGTADFRIGRTSSGYYYDGLIDECGVWKRLLSADDIAALYNGGAGLTYAAFTT